ncbi:peptidoglycan DD-metalloendopeptidase family protein [Coralloluteibacterium thermophilus]|uniref:Peptidoglycan DD-metalloendopeptidase family protein n=1 Tax=Coralloluteibacterium thermophilum TaxID=2707049 RepID=A0ABV9NM21_9GAMM
MQGTVVGALLLVVGLGFGMGVVARAGADASQIAELRRQVEAQERELAGARDAAQLEINALAARIGELQAQANRLNALGERLTRLGNIDDGEFDFSEASGQGGAETAGAVDKSELLSDLDGLEQKFGHAGAQLDLLESLLLDRDLAQNQMPNRWPVTRGYISSGFGRRNDPFGGGRAHHLGIDFASPGGSDVLAVAEGVVSFAGWRTGYGNVVEIDHGNGYKTLYGHNRSNSVKAGDLVRVGDVIAKVGSTGRSTGNHVHLEVHHNGRPVNPLKYLQGRVGARSRG